MLARASDSPGQMWARAARSRMRGMLERLGSLSAARPRRTLAVVFAFVVLAGVLGGPVAGQLTSSGGFTAGSSESSRADAQFERVTGQGTSPGVVLLVRGQQADLDQR